MEWGRRGAIGSGVVLDGEAALDTRADVKMAKVLKVLKVLNFPARRRSTRRPATRRVTPSADGTVPRRYPAENAVKKRRTRIDVTLS